MIKKLLILFIPIAIACAQEDSTEFSVNEAIVDKEVTQEVSQEIDSVKYNIPWLDSFSINNTLFNRVKPPIGYFRKMIKMEILLIG